MDQQARIAVDCTLCDIRGGVTALTALGIPVGPDRGINQMANHEQVAVRTCLLRNELDVDIGDLVPADGGGRIESLMVPIVAESLSAIDTVQVEVGWNCFVVGRGIVPQVLIRVAQLAGARTVDTIADVASAAPGPTPRGPGKTAYFAYGQDNESIRQLLYLVPEESTVVLMRSESSAPVRVNFYAGIHRSNVELRAARSEISREALVRANRMVKNRNVWDDMEIPVIPHSRREDLGDLEADGVILQWS